MVVGGGVVTDADCVLCGCDFLLVVGDDVVLGGGVVVGDGVVVSTNVLIGVLIVLALADLLNEGGPDDGVIVVFGVEADADRLLCRRDRLLCRLDRVLVNTMLGGGVVLGSVVVVGDDLLVAVLIVSALAPLLRAGGAEDGVTVGVGMTVDGVFPGCRCDIELWIGCLSPSG